VIYYNFLKDSTEINKKEKNEITVQNHSRGYLTGFKSSRDKISGFIVQIVKGVM